MRYEYDHRPLKNDVELGGHSIHRLSASIFVCVVVVEGSVHIEKRLNNLWGVQRSSSSSSIRITSNIGLSIIKKIFRQLIKPSQLLPKKENFHLPHTES